MKTLKIMLGMMLMINIVVFSDAQGWNYRDGEKEYGDHGGPKNRDRNEDRGDDYYGKYNGWEKDRKHGGEMNDYERFRKMTYSLKELEVRIEDAKRDRQINRREARELNNRLEKLWDLKFSIENDRRYDFRKVEIFEREKYELEMTFKRMLHDRRW